MSSSKHLKGAPQQNMLKSTELEDLPNV